MTTRKRSEDLDEENETANSQEHQTRRISDGNSALESTGLANDGIPQREPDAAEQWLLEYEKTPERQKEEMQHGCSHYRRRCKFLAPCCNQFVWCRHCHNQKCQTEEKDPTKRHEIDRSKITHLACMICNEGKSEENYETQELNTHCKNCGTGFGKWACLKCRMFDDDISKKQFHCHECGICRVGGRENFFHCHKCNSCYANSLEKNHVCVANSMRGNCPVCLEDMFDSIRRCSVLTCGHTVHEDCLQELTKANTTTCPLCFKSLQDLSSVWELMRAEVEATPMPAEYANWKAEILCNDCLERITVPFHFVGLKCDKCGGFNTRMISIDKGN